MAICMLHQHQLDSLCPCSENHEKGKALANVLQKQCISLTAFWQFIKIKYDLNDYSVQDSIEHSEDHTLIAREMVDNNTWNKLYFLIEEMSKQKKQKKVVKF